ncbi:MAG: hypothetical protein HYZ63_00930 [Candidatus Andersenbacteria bacterium]|nr:hypothetical protein [Candidatus Andersenbacteria bacterium]
MDQTTPPQPPQPEFNIDFRPNMYPIMYWAIAYGAIAGVALFLVRILAEFIGLLWAPVFLVGLVWGGYRQYQKQKAGWRAGRGIPTAAGSPMDEFKQAVGDVVTASREMMAEQRAEDAAQTAQAEVEPETPAEEIVEEEVPPQTQPPQA